MGIDTSKIDFNDNGEVQILDEQLLEDVVGGISKEEDGIEEPANGNGCGGGNCGCNNPV